MTKAFYLTDGKSWVDYWNGERYEPVSEKRAAKLLAAIKRNEIAIHWRSERVAEFVV